MVIKIDFTYSTKRYLKRYYYFFYFLISLPYSSIIKKYPRGNTPSSYSAFSIFLKWTSNIILNKNTPRYFMLGLTYRCQAKCQHCCVGDYSKEKDKELTTKEVKRIIDQAFNLGVYTVNFFGGEAILRSDILELINYASKKGIYTYLDTNALALTKKKIKQLKNIGLSMLFISIDSPFAEMHDKLRGVEGCFDNAVKSIKYISEIGLPCIINTYMSKGRIKELEGIIKLGKKLGAQGVRIARPIQAGRWLKTDVRLTEEEEEKVKNIIDFKFVFPETIYNKSKECSGLLKKTFFYLSPYGDVQPCFAIPISFGNIREEPLKVILERMWKHEMFKNDSYFLECPMNNKTFRKNYIETLPKNIELPVSVEYFNKQRI